MTIQGRVSGLSDQQLVDFALDGEELAYAELVARYQAQVFSVIYHVLVHTAASQDAAQETFFKAFKDLDDYCPDFRFSSWICRIAHSKAVDYLRWNNKGGPKISLDGAPNAMTPDLMAATRIDVEDPGHSALDAVLNGELNAEIEDAVERLRPRYQQCFRWLLRDGRPYPEVAQLMGVTVEHLRVIAQRTREQLAVHLKRHLRN